VIVVTDTSVILNLTCIRQELLLRELFGSLLAPPSVAAEFSRLANSDPRFQGLSFPSFIRVVAPAGIPHALVGNQKLHSGEIAAISLALQEGATALLMDESAGRKTASELGLRCIGILGILIEAKRCGLVREVAPLLDQLASRAGFWIAPGLRNRVLGLVAE
jgi:hypothetical protein